VQHDAPNELLRPKRVARHEPGVVRAPGDRVTDETAELDARLVAHGRQTEPAGHGILELALERQRRRGLVDLEREREPGRPGRFEHVPLRIVRTPLAGREHPKSAGRTGGLAQAGRPVPRQRQPKAMAGMDDSPAAAVPDTGQRVPERARRRRAAVVAPAFDPLGDPARIPQRLEADHAAFVFERRDPAAPPAGRAAARPDQVAMTAAAVDSLEIRHLVGPEGAFERFAVDDQQPAVGDAVGETAAVACVARGRREAADREETEQAAEAARQQKLRAKRQARPLAEPHGVGPHPGPESDQDDGDEPESGQPAAAAGRDEERCVGTPGPEEPLARLEMSHQPLVVRLRHPGAPR
jgi:hypothetical protein